MKASPGQRSLCYHKIEKKPVQEEQLQQHSYSTENCSLTQRLDKSNSRYSTPAHPVNARGQGHIFWFEHFHTDGGS